MAERKVYSCDWCGVDSPSPGFIGDTWKIIADPENGSKVCLCGECIKVTVIAWREVRERCIAAGKMRGNQVR